MCSDAHNTRWTTLTYPKSEHVLMVIFLEYFWSAVWSAAGVVWWTGKEYLCPGLLVVCAIGQFSGSVLMISDEWRVLVLAYSSLPHCFRAFQSLLWGGDTHHSNPDELKETAAHTLNSWFDSSVGHISKQKCKIKEQISTRNLYEKLFPLYPYDLPLRC